MRLLSPRELAEALGVSESSLKRWVDAGKISASRTDGGHRRISLPEAVRFIRDSGAPLAHPEVLDMPEVAVAQKRALVGADHLLHYLEQGDVIATRGWLMARYLSGTTVAELCDGPVREAMHSLGELWRHDEGGIFVEHRGTDVCLQALAHLRSSFLEQPVAPVALGGAPEDDPYLLPSFMAAMVVATSGMRAVNLGPDTPVSAFQAACAHHQPRVVWVSVSSPLPSARARELASWLAALPAATVPIVGGRESHAITYAHPGLRRVDTMGELSMMISDLAATTPPPPAT